jgi:hypothetical protein
MLNIHVIMQPHRSLFDKQMDFKNLECDDASLVSFVSFWFHVLNNVHHVFVLVNCEFKFLGTSSTINHILVVANVNLS